MKRTNSALRFFAAMLIVILLAPAMVVAGHDDMTTDNILDPTADNGWPAARPAPTPQPRAWRDTMITERPLTRRQQGMDLRGFIPVVASTFGPEEQAINEHISDEVVASLISEARRILAQAITFRHEVYSTSEVVSIVIYADVSVGIPRTWVRSVNFCLIEGRLLTMNEAMNGMDIVSLAERKIAEMVRRDPDRYYAALSASLDQQAFYVTDRELVLLFDEFRLSTRNEGVDTIRLTRNNIRTVTLSRDEYIEREDGYSLKMIPLRLVVEDSFGYRIGWDEAQRRIEIRHGGRVIIELRHDENNFIVTGVLQRSLEAAPIVIDDITFVPITFFDQILPLTTYTICGEGSITFLAYLAG